MNQYVQVITQAAVIFPFIAAAITLPYLVFNYRKHGSVMSLRVPIVYSFILYLLCCYFLVILPLPSQEYVAKLTGPTTQLIPFTFVTDIIYEAHLASAGGFGDVVRSILVNRAFYQVIMNVLMFIPLGIYLKYYFNCSLRRTILLSFGLSLFFELTQLSGLYFIYPRGYRLFDIDDLMINTLGGVLGYALAIPLAKFLPSRTEINQASFRRSQKVSLLRRIVSLICDGIAITVILVVTEIVLANIKPDFMGMDFVSTAVLIIFGYFGVLPIFINSQTIGQKLTRMQVARKQGGPARWYQHLGRITVIILVMLGLPYTGLYLISYLTNNNIISYDGVAVFSLSILAFYVFFILFEMIRAAIHKPLFYERWTNTRLISTTSIKKPAEVDDEQSATTA